MIDAIYDAASGLEAYIKNQEVIARNIANANTAGFKKSIVDFSIVLSEVDGVETETIEADIGVDFSKGKLEYTGNSLEIAIDGEGFFTIQTDEGMRYTRNGQFQLSNNGEIITASGGKLLGELGPLEIPPGSSVIKIDTNGTVKADGGKIGDLLITNFKDLSLVVPTGLGLFKAPLMAIQDDGDVNYKIAQGYKESSNVNVAMEMVNMIANMRSYEATNKIIKSLSDTMEQLISSQSSI